MTAPTRTVIGCMTGTSLDGLDAAAVRVGVCATGGVSTVRADFLEGVSAPLGEAAAPLRALASGRAMTAAEIARAGHELGIRHAEAIADLAARRAPDLIAVHGQTVFHAPPLSWQWISPWPIADRLRVQIVCDLRGADLAAGGEGAPITPLADWIALRSPDESRCVVNLGGFCNLTVLPAGAGPEAVSARDVCACNQLLDAIAREALRAPFDRDGAAASAGDPDGATVHRFGAALEAQSDARRSLGTGDELETLAAELAGEADAGDLAASACRAIAGVIAKAVPKGVDRVLVAGGGTHNARLLAELGRAVPAPVEPTDSAGLPAAFREAASIAVLGSLALDGAAITLPGVTRHGHTPVRAGLWITP